MGMSWTIPSNEEADKFTKAYLASEESYYEESLQPVWKSKCMNTKVDMVEVVRCKDCIHYRYYGLTADTVSECVIGHCEKPDRDWFCADGERRTNDG